MKSYIYSIFTVIAILIFLFAGCDNHAPINSPGLHGAPNLPSNPNPPDSSVNIPRFVTLQWTCSDPENDPLTYDVYLDYADPPLIIVAEGITVNTYSSGLLQPNTRLNWKIVAKDNNNGSTEGSIWHFTTTN